VSSSDTPLRDVTAIRPGEQNVRKATTVVYIAGSGRSGSTLLERMLGGLPGFVNAGEINDMFRRMAMYDELCGCGRTFFTCEFWVGVGERAFGGWSRDLIDEVVMLQSDVVRQRYLARLMLPRLARPRYLAQLERYGEIHARLYAAIVAQSGARVVVDASKGASFAMAIARGGGVDLRMIHLVRDARGVAFSWAKANVSRPHGDGPRATMHRFNPSETAARWAILQAEIAASRRYMQASVRLRYEDLVAAPAEQIVRCVQALGLAIDPAKDLAYINGRTVDLAQSHGLSGNPSRFRSGPQELRADEQWRTDMARWDRFSTTAIAAGSLARYGYLPPQRSKRAS
jgi:hypothetical protein